MDKENRHIIKLSAEKHKKFQEFLMGDDLDFYEEYVINLTDEEQKYFFRENPDFMSEYPVSKEKLYLLRDKIYRNIMREIKKYNSNQERKK